MSRCDACGRHVGHYSSCPSHTRPTVTITQQWNGGDPRWGWTCNGCQAARVGIRTQHDAHRAASEHLCDEVGA